MSAPTPTVIPTPQDRTAMLFAIGVGVVVVGYTLFEAVRRIIEVIGNADVPVAVAFADTPATLPVGPGGSSVDVVASEVIVHVSDMAVITVVSLVLAELISAIAIILTVVCVCLIMRNIMRGQAFNSTNVALVGTATLTVAIGWALTWLFTTMGANGAASALAGSPSDNTAFPIEFITIFAIAALGGLSTAFVAGNRLQRDTEGLV